ncbi:hypothetical protein Y032_0008g289 [Ancylostoma ceylanicum]|nr:hypothetical protein Y032_0008g289 [Ancylostoma ceylanicum]
MQLYNHSITMDTHCSRSFAQFGRCSEKRRSLACVMSPWLLVPVMIAPFCYASSVFTCGCGEKEVERIRKEAAQEQQRQQSRQSRVPEDASAEHRREEKNRRNLNGSGEIVPGVPASAPAQKPLPQPLHPPPAAAQPSAAASKPAVVQEGGDDGYEACPDLTPQELQRIAAQT